MAVQFRNDEITALLRQAVAQPSEGTDLEGSVAVKSSCDVSYVIFLEPRDGADPNWSTVEWLADEAIRRFSPAPALAHCELVLPPIPDSDGGRVHFATYMGRGGAGWQNHALTGLPDGHSVASHRQKSMSSCSASTCCCRVACGPRLVNGDLLRP